ncbi:MAG: variant-type mycofactocin precursor [Desulfomonilaceae bacterium]
MEHTERPIPEHTNVDALADVQVENEDLTLTEIDIEEVAIDGICGVY